MTTTEAALREALEKAGCSQLEATRIISMLSQPSPASSTAGEAEQTAWAWLERRSAEHPNDVTAYGTDDMVDAFMAGAASYQRVLATFANDLEMADFANVGSALNERMCCNGHMCGCRGASVGEYLAHELRSLSPSSGEPASVAVEAIKTWEQRAEEHPDHEAYCVTPDMIQQRMQEEIDDLRAALSKPTPVEAEKATMIRMADGSVHPLIIPEATQAPVEAGLREKIALAMVNESLRYLNRPDAWTPITDLRLVAEHVKRDQLRYADAILAALSETQPPRETSTETKESGDA